MDEVLAEAVRYLRQKMPEAKRITSYARSSTAAQRTVDNAHMRYYVVHLHRLLDPEKDT